MRMPSDDIGHKIFEARFAANLTQKQLADRLGITGAAIAQWENGRAKPNPQRQEQLEKILGPLGRVDPATPSVGFGAWLRQEREAKSLTAQELSNRSGVSVAQIYNLESGRVDNPRKSTVK